MKQPIHICVYERDGLPQIQSEYTVMLDIFVVRGPFDKAAGSPLRPSTSALKTPLYIAKGAVQASLSRAAVQWMNLINLTQLITQFNSGQNSVDEMLMSTLQIAEHWKMPGGFTDRCIKHGFHYDGITRMVQWKNSSTECKANFLRHLVCVLGVEDLPSILKYRHILVNKMLPSFDYGAIACVSELLFNRTHFDNGNDTLDVRYYENLPIVRFNKATNQKNMQELCQNPYEYK
ncbi:Beta-1,3-galactosyl-O-glycosyl-glycoprotein beta-1,6-N-acetylglucosaminyltransferase [Parelaphostrongylus tenuis]|uniref:Beta-1,3-galactosyl-O-glycosyl-glycoprotein beta-1,6-N-acetylglucosaminyltransferase n=1 Tax=Parelaphostrongylus tenuis TaxID=148309 RepID=A0AAD5MUP0_PARTN|nr:Beta-1,3-galactosyl-O-glycosyl-glycoprotein beta-1,6-N-acetylglucosaminyltransferase [Parelaphostrongylus tenuis]